MRGAALFATLEQIARRGAGWGTAVSLPQEDGTALRIRVSMANAFRNLIRSPDPKPRADKGRAYVTDAAGTRRIIQ